MSIATASDPEMAPARPLLMPLLSATACVALADWLFYDWQIGISLALFLGVLGAVAVAGNRVYAARTVQIVMAAIFAAGLLALIEDVNVLSVIVGALATALFVIVMTARENSSWQWNLFEAAIAPLRVLVGQSADRTWADADRPPVFVQPFRPATSAILALHRLRDLAHHPPPHPPHAGSGIRTFRRCRRRAV